MQGFSVLCEKLAQILSVFNEIILKASSEEEIFQKICKHLVEALDFKMAWIGVADHEEGVVKPLYYYGYEEGYLSEIKIKIDSSLPEGRGPTATALREGRIVINPDTRTNPDYVAFRESALKRGYLSSASIPIFVNNKLKYTLNLYAKEPLFFSEEVVKLLEKVKENLEYALEKAEKNLFYYIISKALEESDIYLFLTDEQGNILYVNSMVSLYLGYTYEDILGRYIHSFLEPEDKNVCPVENLFTSLTNSLSYVGIYFLRKRNGEIIYLDLKIIPISYSFGRRYYLFIGRDISLEKNLLESLEQIRNYDVLTGLYSYAGIFTRTKEIFENLSNLILIVDIDIYNFSNINDLYGVEKGDRILKLVAGRLKEKFEGEAFIGRISSDEFLLVFYKLKNTIELTKKIEAIFDVFKEPFIIDEERLTLKYSIGCSVFPRDGKDLEGLYRRANSALSYAKREAPNTIKFYDISMEHLIRKNIEIEKLIEEALEKQYFQFYFQPYFDTAKYTLAGAEALIRIVKPDGEVISPYVFIEILEKLPFRKEFEIWAIKTIIAQINAWALPIGLNLYAKTFTEEDFWSEVSPYLKELKYPLILEITERALLKENKKTLEIIRTLKEEYSLIKISIDDFGTGYSNLAYLIDLPIDKIKIDISFVRFMDKHEKKRGIVKTIIDLAHILSAKALAEGVESKEIVEILEIMGCDYLQGFYFDQPLPKEEFEKKYLLK